MSKKVKITLIAVACAVLALCLGTAGYIAVVNVQGKPVFLGREIEGENLEQLVAGCVNDYFADKTVTVKHNQSKTEIFVTEIANVDIKATTEKINTELSEKSLFSFNKNEIMPVFVFDDNALKTLISKFTRDNNIGYDFFTVDLEIKKAEVDLTKSIVDINSTVQAVFNKISKLDFTDTDVEFTVSPQADYIYSLINTQPKDAELKIENDEINITKEQIGFNVDKNQLAQAVASGKQQFTVDITEILQPEITEKILMDKQMFGDVLSSCSSYYNANVAGRARNVELAASKINGLVMQPGDVFSYNRVVGPRTYENGFKDAGVYTANGLESGVGGGICQVSSTLYGAQLMADLKTVTRTNHSYTIGYLPSGQDATVSYGAIDYKFENSMHFPIKIECIASGGLLTVRILGIKTDAYREIKLYNQVISTRDFETVEKEVEDLQSGEQRITQSGQKGMTVDTYKIYYKNGIEEKRKFVHKSTYIPMPQIVEKGKQEEITEDVPVDTQPVIEEIPDEMYEEPVTEENGGTAQLPETQVNTEFPENDNQELTNNQNPVENQENVVENEEILIN